MNENETKNPIQVSQKIFDVIEFLALNGASSLTDVSTNLDLNKSTAHRILNSLIYMNYVSQNAQDSYYNLTFKICELSNKILNKLDIIELARPTLKRLSDDTNETVHLVKRDGYNAIYINKVECYTNSIRMVSKVGSSIPLYCSGVGKAMLADMNDEVIKDIWQNSNIIAHTKKTILTLSDFFVEINKTRALGYAMDNEENEIGVTCIAASILDYKNFPTYAISISAPTGKMTKERIKLLNAYLQEAKKELAQKINL